MPQAPQEFSDSLKRVITTWRENRKQNLRQRKDPGLVTDWYRARLLLFQSAYMLLTRAIINLSATREDGVVIPADAEFLIEAVKPWVDSVSDQTLFEVLQVSRDELLFRCFLGLYIEHSDMGQELARRLEPKRFTVELIRTQWGEEDRASEVEALFTYGAKQFTPGLKQRFKKDPANEEFRQNEHFREGASSDFSQSAWVTILEKWEKDREEKEKRLREKLHNESEQLQWFDFTTFLPHEQAFFNGPIQSAWRVSLPRVLADFETLSGTESFPQKLRESRKNAVETIERRNSKRVAPNPSSSDCEENHDQIRIEMVNRSEQEERDARANRILLLARAFGPQAEKYVGFLQEVSPKIAVMKSGIDSTTLKAFMGAIHEKFPPSDR